MMKRTEHAFGLTLIALLFGCAAQTPLTGAPGQGAGATAGKPSWQAPAVVRRPLGEKPSAVIGAPDAATSGPLYVCVTEKAGERTQTAIEFAPKVAALCSRHPEMGPCQYERQQCRGRGGRVFADDGQEITREIEDAYDRKVMRARFRAN